MKNSELATTVADLRRALEMIESGVADGELPSESLLAFKVAVDDVRTRIIAMISGVAAGQYPEHVSRLRVSRATQLCANVHADLALGTIDGDSEHLGGFMQAAESLQSKLRAVSI